MDKFFLASKTIQGLIIMAIPMLRGLFGWDWATTQTGADLALIIDGTMGVFGLGLAIYGRVVVAGRIVAVPKATTPTP